MILVVLQLESEFPRTDWTTPSQVSTLEPLLGTLLGSPWCPLNHIFLSFPIWGSCAWFMNLRIQIFIMKMSWFYVVFRSFRGLIMAALDFWLVGLEKKEVTIGWSFPSFLSHHLALCHLRNYGISAFGERIHPLVDTCIFSDLIRQVMTWWEGASAVSIVAEIWLTSSRGLHLMRFVCGLA